MFLCLLQVITVWIRCGKPQLNLQPSPCTSPSLLLCALWSTKKTCSQTPTSWLRPHFLSKASALVRKNICYTTERARVFLYLEESFLYTIFYYFWLPLLFSNKTVVLWLSFGYCLIGFTRVWNKSTCTVQHSPEKQSGDMLSNESKANHFRRMNMFWYFIFTITVSALMRSKVHIGKKGSYSWSSVLLRIHDNYYCCCCSGVNQDHYQFSSRVIHLTYDWTRGQLCMSNIQT